MTGPLLFNSSAKRHAWLKLADMVAEVGVDQIPCSNAPDLYYPDQEDRGGIHQVKLAKKACQTCPLIKPCGEFAIKYKEEYGVWGGLSSLDRRNIRKGKRSA